MVYKKHPARVPCPGCRKRPALMAGVACFQCWMLLPRPLRQFLLEDYLMLLKDGFDPRDIDWEERNEAWQYLARLNLGQTPQLQTVPL